MGDFSIDLFGPRSTFLTNMFYLCNITILPLKATHFTNTSTTLLDLFGVGDLSSVVIHGQVPALGFSSHDLIYCIYAIKRGKVAPKLYYIEILNIQTPQIS